METHKFHLWPQEKCDLPCTDSHPYQIINTASTDTNSFTPLSTVWLSLRWLPGELSLSTPSWTLPASHFFQTGWKTETGKITLMPPTNEWLSLHQFSLTPKLLNGLSGDIYIYIAFQTNWSPNMEVLVNIHLRPEVWLPMRNFHETTLA